MQTYSMHFTYIYTNSKADVQDFFIFRSFQYLCSSVMLIGFVHFLDFQMLVIEFFCFLESNRFCPKKQKRGRAACLMKKEVIHHTFLYCYELFFGEVGVVLLPVVLIKDI